MTAVDEVLAGPWGPALAILAMACATYGCRVGGVLVMQRVRITPAVERALLALPGAIVAATVTPLAIRAGPAGIAGVAVSVLVASLVRHEVLALGCGLAAAAAMRAAGL